MSKNTRILAGLLGSAILGMWLRRSDEPPAAAPEVSRTAPAQPKPAPMSLSSKPLVPRPPTFQNQQARPMVGGQPEDLAGTGQERRQERQKPAAVLEGDTEEIRYWREVVSTDPDPEQRIDALSELNYHDPRAMPVLVLGLRDDDPAVRLAALEELNVSSEEPRLDLLGTLLRDPDPEVRLEAVRLIADSDEPLAEELLYQALGDYDEDVHDEAELALDVDDDDLD